MLWDVGLDRIFWMICNQEIDNTYSLLGSLRVYKEEKTILVKLLCLYVTLY